MEKPPSPTEPPVPWLGKNEPGARQPWSSPTPGYSFLRINYTHHAASQRRCEWWLFLIRLPYTLGSLLKWLATGAIGVTLANTMRHGFSFAYMVNNLGHFVGVAVILELFEIAKRSYAVGKSKDADGLLMTATANGIMLVGLRSPFSVAWSQIAGITCRDGDIFVSPKLAGGKPFAITRNAFADEGVANRFYLALVVLWQSSGNMTVLPSDTLTEFRG